MNRDYEVLILFLFILCIGSLLCVWMYSTNIVKMAKLGFCQTMVVGKSDPIWDRCK